jgi:hypothetical protein
MLRRDRPVEYWTWIWVSFMSAPFGTGSPPIGGLVTVNSLRRTRFLVADV